MKAEPDKTGMSYSLVAVPSVVSKILKKLLKHSQGGKISQFRNRTITIVLPVFLYICWSLNNIMFIWSNHWWYYWYCLSIGFCFHEFRCWFQRKSIFQKIWRQLININFYFMFFVIPPNKNRSSLIWMQDMKQIILTSNETQNSFW